MVPAFYTKRQHEDGQPAVSQSEKHPHIPARKLLDRVVLGGSDGAIEGVAMTAALNGAGIPFATIVLAGIAFAVAGALSMFFSSYLSRRSELASLEIDIAREKMEIETEPEEEKSEMEELLKKDGYSEDEVKVILRRLSQDKGLWLKEMLRRELKVNMEDADSGRLGEPSAAGTAFFLLGSLTVAPYLLAIARVDALAASVALAIVALFTLGSRAFLLRNFDPREGLRSAAVGALAGGLLYVVGLLFSNV